MEKTKIFDLHSDILYDVYQASLKGDLERFENYHLPQLKNNISGGIWALYSPSDFNLLEALKVSKSLVNLEDFAVILGIEGLRNLKKVEDLEIIYDLGYRHLMLTWNEANNYATGVKGPQERGLTEVGYQVLDFMIDKEMIIDLSHLNEKSFYDVIGYTNKNIIASHSNIKELCDHPRNLTKEQLKHLKKVNGLLGLTLVGGFISSNKKERTLDNFLKHLEYAINIMGIDNVCFGFDFMDYFNPKQTANLEEVKSALEVNNLINILVKAGYSKNEIEKLTFYNVFKRYHNLIYKKERNHE